jgi:hypothetical protein
MLLLSHLFKTEKDIWDILQVVSAVFIPIAIAFGTYWIQKSIPLLRDEYGRPSYAPTWLVEDQENE